MKHLLLIACSLLFNTHALEAQHIEHKNDNYRYFREVGVNVGSVIFHGDGTNINVEGANFILPNIGIRSGATLYTDMINTGWGVKVPALIAFRTSDNKFDYDSESEENWDNSIGEDIFYSILYSLPMRAEFNIGPAFGYMAPDSESKRLTTNEKQQREDYFVNTKLLVTMDANLKLSLVISRVNLSISGGASYFITNNYKYYAKDNYADEKDGKIARWMGHVSFGTSYRF